MHRIGVICCGAVFGLLFVQACVGEDPGTSNGGLPPDGSSDGAGTIDGTTPPGNDSGTDSSAPADGGCNKQAPFGAAVIVDDLSSAQDDGRVTFSLDESQVFFHSTRTGVGDIYSAIRDTNTNKYDPSTLYTSALNRPTLFDFDVTLSADDKLLVFVQHTGSEHELKFSKRAGPTVAFDGPQPVTFSAQPPTQANEYPKHVFLTELGHLYFAMTRPNTGNQSFIFRASRVADGSFGEPIKQQIPKAEGFDQGPVVTADERTMYFTRSNDDAGTDYDIYMTKRTQVPDGAWDEPMKVDNVNSPERDLPSWLSSDGCRLYIISTRANGKGAGDIYVAKRPSL